MKRRAFLRGVSGATMALPTLEAIASSEKLTARRMVCVGLNFGLVPQLFPTSTGKEYQLTERLQPLNKLHKDFTVFSGLDHGTEAKVDTAECMPICQGPLQTLSGTCLKPTFQWTRKRRAGGITHTLSITADRQQQWAPTTRFRGVHPGCLSPSFESRFTLQPPVPEG